MVGVNVVFVAQRQAKTIGKGSDLPIYEYRCTRGHTTEQYAPNAEQSIECPKCGIKASRIFSPPVIHFRGSGFYDTDYRQRKHHGAKEDHSTPQETKEKADAGKGSTSK